MASFACRTVEVTGHHEVDGHTMYVIEGTAGDASWRAEKRLVELRALHDRVVESLGRPRYDALFAGACFASQTQRSCHLRMPLLLRPRHSPHAQMGKARKNCRSSAAVVCPLRTALSFGSCCRSHVVP